MAIYHLSVKTISRSAGRSATAAAAYRAGVEIVDERTGETHDYRRRSGVLHTEIVMPPHVTVTMTREQLWNAAEQAEKRKNSTVAREFEIALPSELTRNQQIELARAFANEISCRHSIASDVAIHAPSSQFGDDRNVHAHILLTTRRLDASGAMTEKSRELDDKKSGEIAYWREHFAEITNAALERAGHNVRVDHRTLEAQGINRAPTIHKGPAVTAMTRRGESTHHQDRAAAVVAAALAKASASVSIEREIKRAEQEHRAPAQAQDLILYRAHKLERELQQARAESDQARDELKSITLQAPRHAATPPRSREQIELRVKIKIDPDKDSMTLEQARRERDRSRAVFDEQERAWNAQSFIKRGVGIGKSDLFEAARKLDAANSTVDLIERTLEQSPRVRTHIDKLVIDERQRYESEREAWQQYEREKRRFTAVSSDVESAERRAQDALHALNALSESTNESLLQHQHQHGHGHEMSM